MLNKDFALIAKDGRVLHPFLSLNEATGRFGYVCSTPELGRGRDNDGKGGYYTENISEVIEGVILRGWGVRARMDKELIPKGTKNPSSTHRFGKISIIDYWVAPQYQKLVDTASRPPLKYLPKPFESSESAAPIGRSEAEAEVESDPQCKGIQPTEREALINARIGQGRYRREMITIWGNQCALTGLSLGSALIASHAQAWKRSSNEERLDPYNGLLLAATVDKLFDCGLISFAEDGAMLVGPSVTAAHLSAIGLTSAARLSNRLHEKHQPYLRAHREQHGFEDDDAATA